MKLPHITAVTGGIGAGKSVVSNMLRVMGYDVFDCDAEAKRLMDSSAEIKARLCSEISPMAVRDDGSIDRQHISSIVFFDDSKLKQLNAIVHAAVIDEIHRWRVSLTGVPRVFVETAILYQSGMDKLVDDVWDVIAPDELRIERVMARNNADRRSVEARINSQNYVPDHCHASVHEIVNDDMSAVLPRILELL